VLIVPLSFILNYCRLDLGAQLEGQDFSVTAGDEKNLMSLCTLHPGFL